MPNEIARQAREQLRHNKRTMRKQLFSRRALQKTLNQPPDSQATYGGVTVDTLKEPESPIGEGQPILQYLATRQRSIFCDMLTLECETFKRYCLPGVYIFANGDEVLYVGSNRRMLSRIASDNHESAIRSTSEATTIYFLPCPSEASARFEEVELIRQLRPKYNIVGVQQPRP